MTHEFIALNDHRKEVVNQHDNVHTITLEYPSLSEDEDDDKKKFG